MLAQIKQVLKVFQLMIQVLFREFPIHDPGIAISADRKFLCESNRESHGIVGTRRILASQLVQVVLLYVAPAAEGEAILYGTQIVYGSDSAIAVCTLVQERLV